MVITVELFIQELKDRMSDSLYWQGHRRIKKRIIYAVAITKEVVDLDPLVMNNVMLPKRRKEPQYMKAASKVLNGQVGKCRDSP